MPIPARTETTTSKPKETLCNHTEDQVGKLELLFDIETNGLYWDATKIHSLVIKNIHSGEVWSGSSMHGPEDHPLVRDGLTDLLLKADTIIGHNIIDFDIPVIQKLYPWFKPKAKVLDTLVLSRLFYPDLAEPDFQRTRKGFPKKLIGSHSLEAWGHRLGEYKGDFGKTTDWSAWSPEMQSYCEQDVEVNHVLYLRLMEKAQAFSVMSVNLEHEFAKVITQQKIFGFCFNQPAAVELAATLAVEKKELKEKLQDTFEPTVVQLKTKQRITPFNPGSRQQIADRLRRRGWEPTEFTQSGQAKISEETLKTCPVPEAKLLLRYLLLDKRLGQISSGDQGWLKHVNPRTGRIHGDVITNGAVTGRCTHSRPNIAQVPSVGAEYGYECRALFGPPPGWVQIGADASGLELRCLAHYLARHDGGAYGKIILEGDIHTENQKAAGLDTRNQAKTFIYAWLYGAGDVKIGSIVEPLADEETQKKIGAKLKKRFLKNQPALKKLKDDISRKVADQGYLRGIDGRKLRIRHEHAALNTLLQSAGAIVMKMATVILYEKLSTAGLVWGRDWAQMAHIHDEYQLACLPAFEAIVSYSAVEAIVEAGQKLGFRCPLDGEAKIGNNWAETH